MRQATDGAGIEVIATVIDRVAIKHTGTERLTAYRDKLRRAPKLAYLFLELAACCNLVRKHRESSCLRKGFGL